MTAWREPVLDEEQPQGPELHVNSMIHGALSATQ